MAKGERQFAKEYYENHKVNKCKTSGENHESVHVRRKFKEWVRMLRRPQESLCDALERLCGYKPEVD